MGNGMGTDRARKGLDGLESEDGYSRERLKYGIAAATRSWDSLDVANCDSMRSIS